MTGIVEGKIALVTGGGGGIGRAAALAFAREGARVAIADFAAAAAGDTVAQINAAGGQAITLTGDVTRAEDVRAMVQDTLSAYGRVDCAFNNAGIAPYQVNASGQKTAEWSEASFDRMIAVNLKGVWLCMESNTQTPEGIRRLGLRRRRREARSPLYRRARCQASITVPRMRCSGAVP